MAIKKKPSRTESVDQYVTSIGKMPPQALDLEEAVLGAIMLEKDAFVSVMDILKADHFYNDTNRKIFEAIVELSKNILPIDLLTVTEELKRRGDLDEVGGPLHIARLTSRVGSAAHLEFHSRIVAQKFIQRELIRVSSEIQRRAFDEGEDVKNLLDYSENELFRIAEGSIKKESKPVSLLMSEAIEQIHTAGKREDGLSGVPSGFTNIDRITGGWQRSDLIIIAARPAMGKTALVLTMARNMAVEHKRPVAVFSMEMSSMQLTNRLIVSETELPIEKIRNGKLELHEWEQLMHKTTRLSEAPLFIDDTPAITIFELRAKCRRLVAQHGIQAVILDYLQLMSSGSENFRAGSREQEVSQISRSLKALAKDLNVPIIALSQLNRSVETRSGEKRPQLSDLRESGAIEQDADVVIFIHRPEKYGFTVTGEGKSTKGLAELFIAKHRNGAIADIELKFEERIAKFMEWEDDLDEISDTPHIDSGSMNLPSKMNNVKPDSGFEPEGKSPF